MSKNRIQKYIDYGNLLEISNPGQIPDLILWLDSQDAPTIIESGGVVTSWQDKSIEGNNFNSTVGREPSYISSGGIGGAASVVFQGGDILTANISFEVPDGTAFCVVNLQDPGNSTIFLDNNIYSLRYEQWQNTNLMGYTHYGVADYVSTISSNYNADDIIIFTKTVGSNFIEIQNVNVAGQQLNTGGDKPIPFGTIGRANSTTTDTIIGNIGEIIVYDRQLSPAERTLVFEYLKDRWNI